MSDRVLKLLWDSCPSIQLASGSSVAIIVQVDGEIVWGLIVNIGCVLILRHAWPDRCTTETLFIDL
jgi:hypothetical protein